MAGLRPDQAVAAPDVDLSEPTTGIEPFSRLVDQVMSTEPYASANRVFWIVDNGSSRRGQAAIDRMAADRPTARMVHLPVHASGVLSHAR